MDIDNNLDAAQPGTLDDSSFRAFTWFRICVALLLLVAVISKLARFVEIISADGLLSDPWLLRTAIGVEAAVCLFVFLGDAIQVRRLILLVFGSFIAAAGYAVLTDQQCNCIAEFIPAWMMLIVDISVFGLALVVKPEADRHKAVSVLQALAVSAVAGAVFLVIASQRGATPEAPAANEPIEFLLADSLIDQSWPLGDHLHPALKGLESEKWLIVVVRRDCDHCRQLLTQVFADPQRHPPDTRTAVFVSGTNEWPFQFDHVAVDIEDELRLSWPGGEPFVASPAVFCLNDGHVVQAADGQEADELLKGVFQDN